MGCFLNVGGSQSHKISLNFAWKCVLLTDKHTDTTGDNITSLAALITIIIATKSNKELTLSEQVYFIHMATQRL